MNSPKLTYSPKLTLSPRLSQLRKYHISDKLKAFDGKVMVRLFCYFIVRHVKLFYFQGSVWLSQASGTSLAAFQEATLSRYL